MSNKDLSEDDYHDTNSISSRGTMKGYLEIISTKTDKIENKDVYLSQSKDKENSNNRSSTIIIIIFIIIIIILIAIIVYRIFNPDKEEEKEEKISDSILIFSENFENDNNGSKIENFKINETGKYRICVFGAKAIVGGKGGKTCSIHSFNKNSTIEFYFEGRRAGGKGGKGCGYTKGDAYDGAGLGQAVWKYHEDEFKIIAGGGGGSSENNENMGGDFEQDGKGKYGGKRAKSSDQGKRGDHDAEDGREYHGGNGGGNTGTYWFYCGGGGGNGYFGGGGGGRGYSSQVGGGGGGSNFCVANICEDYSLNNGTYSGGIIIKL